ncbi:MAG TPA: Crp/Fnr family transcriptional regulator [Polyangiaceae bacterium]|jgi:CRP/FNR family transcriptional regulator|nr:Crp/Fnr family transcriptional regulator [Polyangiaceae bacterium]
MPQFHGVQREVMTQLARVATTQTYNRGEHLWRAGDMPFALMWIKSGLVKLTRVAPHGRTALCGLFGAPSNLGELALLKGVPFPTNTIAASRGVTVVSIPRSEIMDALHRDPVLCVNLLQTIEARMAMLHDKIDVLSAGTVEARLATLLLKLYHQFGDDFEDGQSRIPVPLSRQELADLVATSFETAIRIASRFERSGFMTTDADGFTIHDLEALHRASGLGDGPHLSLTRAFREF